MIKYSIIVPVRDRIRQIEVCIQNLLSINYSKDRFDISVVDNGSQDGTADFVIRKFPDVKLIREDAVIGADSARNEGARHASGEWLLFTDSDCIADREILRRYDSYVDGNEVKAVAGGIRFQFRDVDNPYEIYDSQRWLKQQRAVIQHNSGCTANLLVRRDLFIKAGGLPEGFTYAGDDLFGRRLAERGVRVGYADGAFVSHPTRRSLSELFSKAYRIGVGYRQAFDRFHLRSFRLSGFKLLVPRPLRVWEMKAAVRGGLLLYMKLLRIDWRVNLVMRAGFLSGPLLLGKANIELLRERM